MTVEKSRAEIEATLVRYGAQSFMYGWDAKGAQIAFVVDVGEAENRQVRFVLPLPSRDEYRFTHHARGRRTATAARRDYARGVAA